MNDLSVPSSRFVWGPISWYGLLIVIGIILAVYLSVRESKRLQLPEDTILDLSLWILPSGIIGARLYYVLFSPQTFLENPVSILYIWEGGLAIYGGLIAGFLAIAFFCRKRKLSMLMMLDILVPGVVLAQSIGRWGNYFNQEAYGVSLAPNSFLAFFPMAVQIPSGNGFVWHAATFFYESLLDFAIFLFLLWGRRKIFHRKGDSFLFYLLLYGAGRLIIEQLRMDSLYLGRSVRISQLISVLFVLFVYTCFAVRYIRMKKCGSFERLIPFIPWIFAIPVLLFCCGFLPSTDSRPMLILFLSCYSLIMIFSAFRLYYSFHGEEIVYADHKAV